MAEGGKLRAHIAGLTSWLAQSTAGAMAASAAGPAPGTWRMPAASSVAPDGPFSPTVTSAAMESAFADGVAPADGGGVAMPPAGGSARWASSTSDGGAVARSLFSGAHSSGVAAAASGDAAGLLTPGMTLTMADMDATQPPRPDASAVASAPPPASAPAPRVSAAPAVQASAAAAELAGESQFVDGGAASPAQPQPRQASRKSGSGQAGGVRQRKAVPSAPPLVADVVEDDADGVREGAGGERRSVDAEERSWESVGSGEGSAHAAGSAPLRSGPIVVTVARGVASSRDVLADAGVRTGANTKRPASGGAHTTLSRPSSRAVAPAKPQLLHAHDASPADSAGGDTSSGGGPGSKLTRYFSAHGRSSRDVRDGTISGGARTASPIGRDVFDPADEPPASGRGIPVSKLLAHVKHGVPLPSHHTRPDGDGVWGEVVEEAKAAAARADAADTSHADAHRTPSRTGGDRRSASVGGPRSSVAQPLHAARSTAVGHDASVRGSVDGTRGAPYPAQSGGPTAPTLTAFARTVLASGGGVGPGSRATRAAATGSSATPHARSSAGAGQALSPLQRALHERPVYVKAAPDTTAGSYDGGDWTAADSSMLRASALHVSGRGGDSSLGWGPDATAASHTLLGSRRSGGGGGGGGSRIVLTHDVV
jgi:hypothetical protein